MNNWYLLQSRARQEFIAEENLARQKYEVYLPCIKRARKIRNKWQEITEPFFPGYLFIHLDMEAQNTSTIRSTRGVLKLVKFGEETPIAKARSRKYLPAPARSSSAPNSTNRNTKLTETSIGIPKIASPPIHWYPIYRALIRLIT